MIHPARTSALDEGESVPLGDGRYLIMVDGRYEITDDDEPELDEDADYERQKDASVIYHLVGADGDVIGGPFPSESDARLALSKIAEREGEAILAWADVHESESVPNDVVESFHVFAADQDWYDGTPESIQRRRAEFARWRSRLTAALSSEHVSDIELSVLPTLIRTADALVDQIQDMDSPQHVPEDGTEWAEDMTALASGSLGVDDGDPLYVEASRMRLESETYDWDRFVTIGAKAWVLDQAPEFLADEELAREAATEYVTARTALAADPRRQGEILQRFLREAGLRVEEQRDKRGGGRRADRTTNVAWVTHPGSEQDRDRIVKAVTDAGGHVSSSRWSDGWLFEVSESDATSMAALERAVGLDLHHSDPPYKGGSSADVDSSGHNGSRAVDRRTLSGVDRRNGSTPRVRSRSNRTLAKVRPSGRVGRDGDYTKVGAGADLTWHPTTDTAGNSKPGGFGTLLGPASSGSYPIVESGITYDEAIQKYGPGVEKFDEDIPITVDASRRSRFAVDTSDGVVDKLLDKMNQNSEWGRKPKFEIEPTEPGKWGIWNAEGGRQPNPEGGWDFDSQEEAQAVVDGFLSHYSRRRKAETDKMICPNCNEVVEIDFDEDFDEATGQLTCPECGESFDPGQANYASRKVAGFYMDMREYRNVNPEVNANKFYRVFTCSDRPDWALINWGRVGTNGQAMLTSATDAERRASQKQSTGYGWYGTEAFVLPYSFGLDGADANTALSVCQDALRGMGYQMAASKRGAATASLQETGKIAADQPLMTAVDWPSASSSGEPAWGVSGLLACGHYSSPVSPASSTWDFPGDAVPCPECGQDRQFDPKLQAALNAGGSPSVEDQRTQYGSRLSAVFDTLSQDYECPNCGSAIGFGPPDDPNTSNTLFCSNCQWEGEPWQATQVDKSAPEWGSPPMGEARQLGSRLAAFGVQYIDAKGTKRIKDFPSAEARAQWLEDNDVEALSFADSGSGNLASRLTADDDCYTPDGREASRSRLAEEHGGYRLEQDGGKWKVVNHIGEVKSTFDSKEEALKYQRALMVNVPGAIESAEEHEENGEEAKHSSRLAELKRATPECKYCTKTATGTVGDTPVCDDHYDKARKEDPNGMFYQVAGVVKEAVTQKRVRDLEVGDGVNSMSGLGGAAIPSEVTEINPAEGEDDLFIVQFDGAESQVLSGDAIVTVHTQLTGGDPLDNLGQEEN